MAKTELKMNSWLKDLVAALIVGLLAGPLSLVFLANNGLKVHWYLPIVLFPILTVGGMVVFRWLGKYLPIIYRFGKFGEVGSLNFLVDLGVVNLLVLVSGAAVGLITVLYKAISFSVAVANSYLWNREWVFDDAARQEQVKEASKFLAASLVGLGVNLLVYALVYYGGHSVIASISTKSWVSIGTVVGSLAGIVFNFFLYKIWVFKTD